MPSPNPWATLAVDVRYRALLFDLDGTLVDSHGEICLALGRALHDLELLFSAAEVARLVDGSPLERIWEQVRIRCAPESALTYEQFARAYRDHYVRDMGHATCVFDGVLETLDRIAAHRPAPRMSVVSNKAAGSVAPLLAHVGLGSYFELAFGCGGTAIAPKPAPDLLLHAARQLGAPPEDCAMVGDTVLDIQAGKRAGMTTIAISHGMAGREQLRAAGADYLLDDFRALGSVVLPG